MPDYRRVRLPGGTYFFTLVTERRARLFDDGAARGWLREAFRRCRERRPFAIDAIVLLPDHLHTIWTLPRGDADYSGRWALIKRTFAALWLASGGAEQAVGSGGRRQRRRGVLQARFWEHTIRDEVDLGRHADYIHYNPVKHGYVSCPRDWPYSSFHRHVRGGTYPLDWGCSAAGGPPPHLDEIADSALE